MKIEILNRKKIEGQGLIEALIAIAVAGIACLIFLDLAAQNIAEQASVTTSDQMVKSAVQLGEQFKRIVDKDNERAEGTPSLLPDLQNQSVVNSKNCYTISGSSTDPVFTDKVNRTCTYNTLIDCKNAAGSNQTFQIYCVSSLTNNLLIGKIVVGLTHCKTLKSSDECVIPNYEYTVVSRLKGSYLCGNNKCDDLYGETYNNCSHDCPPPPRCGDGIVNGSEQCDGTALNGKSCINFPGYNGGTLNCSAACTYNFASCTTPPPPAASCGDGVVNQGWEQCDDGDVIVPRSCRIYNSTLYSGGTYTCNACLYSFTNCIPRGGNGPTCGNNVLDSGEICDYSVSAYKSCKAIASKYTSGTATCTASCVYDTRGCVVGGGGSGGGGGGIPIDPMEF